MSKILGNGFNQKEPHGNSNIWKYMSLDKFLDLLITSEFHFQNLSQLTDAYEGGAKLPPNDNFVGTTSPQMRQKLPIGSWDGYLRAQVQYKSFVHCWSKQTDESYALWKIYLDGAKQGVAITTSLSRLRREISQLSSSIKGQLYMGEVVYIKPNPAETYEDQKRIFMKMPYYGFEEEWRVAIVRDYLESNLDGIPTFIRLKIDIHELIKNIYISPFMSKSLKNSLVIAIERISPNLSDKIRISDILDE